MKGTLIKQHRKYKNMTLEDLASGICSVSYLSKIEHNSINASDEIYRLIGERLKITLTNINEEFDEDIYQNLHDWHETIQLRDFTLMKKLKSEIEKALANNQNIELGNLYKVILTRHKMTLEEILIPDDTLKEFDAIFPQATKEFQFFYYKTVGLHLFLKAELRQALNYFRNASQKMNELPLEDSEVYFHLALTYSQTRAAVESTYYAEKALKGYKDSLQYSRIVDTYMIIAINYRFLNIHDIAQEYFLKILKVAKYHLTFLEKRRIYHNLGYININMENYDKAIEFLEQAEGIETDDTYFQSGTIYLLALAHYYNENIEECWSYILSGEKMADKQNDLQFKHKFYILKHNLNKSTQEEEFIHELEHVIIPDLRELNIYDDYKDALELLANLYYNKRMYKKSSMYYREANQYKFTQKKDLL
ncbi:transcriptional regulator [Halobacillus salinarum]|uniref:Transcriptional regulator n=1 Tax=Halobacillus salinarum TaxID=2932257 RepID=A0ABY4EL29_9BACI|nr:helix-turn-helix transcriptional regulator [Halobacillus salinarum]UOQ45174.1 transcriptional regulator [Halobacillus salinarum]